MLLMACMPVVIFYLIWLVNTSEGIRSEEGTLLDLVCWPDGNAIPVIIATGSVIAVVIEASIRVLKRFKSNCLPTCPPDILYYVATYLVAT